MRAKKGLWKELPVLILKMILVISPLWMGLPASSLAQTVQTQVNSYSKTFEAALRFTLFVEGGYSNHPADLGGKTYRGILQVNYDNYRRQKFLPVRDVRQIENAEIWEIYYGYWKASRAESMQPVLAITMFDTAVNFGPAGAVKFLQQVLIVPKTGSFNDGTVVSLASQNQEDVAKKLIEARMQYRYKRVQENPSQKVFLQGWLNRDYYLWSYVNWYQQQLQQSAQKR
ncbi:MAG TPA: glycosyl hydrolase 108 family protein [Halomicronema sp.]